MSCQVEDIYLHMCARYLVKLLLCMHARVMHTVRSRYFFSFRTGRYRRCALTYAQIPICVLDRYLCVRAPPPGCTRAQPCTVHAQLSGPEGEGARYTGQGTQTRVRYTSCPPDVQGRGIGLQGCTVRERTRRGTYIQAPSAPCPREISLRTWGGPSVSCVVYCSHERTVHLR